MAQLVDATTRANMPAAGGPTLDVLTDHDKALYVDDGTTFYRVDGRFATWVSMSGSNLISDKGGSVALTGAGTFQVALGNLPADISVVNVRMETTVAFNAGTSATLSVGIAATPTLFSNAVNVFDAAGVETVTPAGAAYRNAVTALIAQFVYVGATPTAGKALVIVEFIKVPTTP
jgi:hypothetical protein